MAVEIPDEVRKRLEEPHFWHLATLNPDGSPHVTPVWADVRDGRIVVNTRKDRKKYRNLANDPRVAMSLTNPDDIYSNMAVQGRVVETIDGEQANRDIDAFAKKYLGVDSYPIQPDEERVSFVIEPQHVWYRPPA